MLGTYGVVEAELFGGFWPDTEPDCVAALRRDTDERLLVFGFEQLDFVGCAPELKSIVRYGHFLLVAIRKPRRTAQHVCRPVASLDPLHREVEDRDDAELVGLVFLRPGVETDVEPFFSEDAVEILGDRARPRLELGDFGEFRVEIGQKPQKRLLLTDSGLIRHFWQEPRFGIRTDETAGLMHRLCDTGRVEYLAHFFLSMLFRRHTAPHADGCQEYSKSRARQCCRAFASRDYFHARRDSKAWLCRRSIACSISRRSSPTSSKRSNIWRTRIPGAVSTRALSNMALKLRAEVATRSSGT